MSETLDRIEALLEQSAQRQAETDAQQRQTSADIETLMAACSTNLTACQEMRAAGAAADARIDQLTERAESNDRRFEMMLAESRADRDEYRALFNDAIAQMEKHQIGWQARFDSQQSVIERLLLSLLDRADAQERLQARVTLLERPREAG